MMGKMERKKLIVWYPSKDFIRFIKQNYSNKTITLERKNNKVVKLIVKKYKINTYKSYRDGLIGGSAKFGNEYI